MKCSPWSSRLGAARGANDPTPENVLLRNHGGGQDPHRVVAPAKKRKICIHVVKFIIAFQDHYRPQTYIMNSSSGGQAAAGPMISQISAPLRHCPLYALRS
jgi:hypothetical protein